MDGRFVILRHDVGSGGEKSHWDLMMELPGQEKLATWRMERNPQTWEAGLENALKAERIGDHRRIYLNYEGEISGGRGSVTRVDDGTVEYKRVEEGLICGQFQGKTVQGTFELREIAEERWELALFVNTD